MRSRKVSSRVTGKQNAARLKDWVSQISVDSIPRNQFGTASRQEICTILGFTRSTVDSNPVIQALFVEMDDRLLAHFAGRKPARSTTNDYIELEERYVALKKQLAEAETKLQRLSYLEDTGMHLDD
jgi:hypothetical protein